MGTYSIKLPASTKARIRSLFAHVSLVGSRPSVCVGENKFAFYGSGGTSLYDTLNIDLMFSSSVSS